MLKRKIDTALSAWKKDAKRKPLFIKGCLKCGKTFAVLNFVKKHYRHVIYLNFAENPQAAAVFAGSLNVDNLVMMLSALLGRAACFEPGHTVIVLDEIEKCPEARTSLKFFHLDGRYDVIALSSLPHAAEGGREPKSYPVGSETRLTMRPLDFEEFLWANGITADVIALLRRCLDREEPVPEALHLRMRQLLLLYAVVGGMPEAVQTFIKIKLMNMVRLQQHKILCSCADSLQKSLPRKDQACLSDCLWSIPLQLKKQNKKFQYSVIRKGGTAAKYQGSLQLIEDAGLIVRSRNLSALELPLEGQARDDIFKAYLTDCGLFMSMLAECTQYEVLQGNLYADAGAVCENLAAGMLSRLGRKLYYFRKESGLEIDFVMRWRGECTLVEVKAVSGNAKSLRTILSHPEQYRVRSAVKLGDYNVSRAGPLLTLPLYLAFLLDEL